MLDIKFIRDNKDIVKEAIKNKKTEDVDLDHLLTLYDTWRDMRQKLDTLNAQKNKAAQERNIEEGKRLKEETQQTQVELEVLEKEFVGLMSKIPNVPSADTPIGPDESGNVVLRKDGDLPTFSFEPKAHWDLGKELDIIDSERAALVSGARFTYLKGDLALMQYALFHFVTSLLTSREKLADIAQDMGLDVDPKPFVPIIPPVMMKSAVMNRMARLHPIDERYFFEKDDMVFIGSAEHTLGPLHMDDLVDEKNLPLRYFAYTPAFRREAGSYGKDTKGILRLHQFDKIEMETFVLPEQSYKEQDFLVTIQEHIVRSLKLPYQVILICTGDMGAPDHRQMDIETWMPAQNKYRETHTSDLIGSYQPRRLNAKVRRAEGKSEYMHMNDATAMAMGRILIAIMENYQQADGSIKIPDVLVPYMGKDLITKADHVS